MASRAKKDAREALSQLQKYLHRDPHACQLLESVSRYQGKLRQECAQLKDDVRALREGSSDVSEVRASLESRTAKLQFALDKEKAITNQLKCDVVNMRKRIGQLEKELEPPDLEALEEVPDDFRKDIAGLRALTRALLRRLKVAPCVRRYNFSKGDKLGAFDVRELVRNYSHEEYTTLGMLVTASAMASMPFVFQWSAARMRDLKVLGKVPDEEWFAIAGRFIKVIRNWISPTKADQKTGLYLPKEVPPPHPKDMMIR